MDRLALAGGLVLTFLLNVPFGYWRAHAKSEGRKSEWFAAIHALVPLVYLVRVSLGASYEVIPIFVLAFFLGQYFGGRLNLAVKSRSGSTRRCMPCDLARIASSRGSSSR